MIISQGVSNVKRLVEWLDARGYEVHLKASAQSITASVCKQTYNLFFLHPAQWQLHLVKQFKVAHSFGLISASRDCFTDYLDEQFPIHIQEPFRPSQFRKLEKQLRSCNRVLLADCMIVKSQRHYHRIPLNEIDFLERDKVSGYTRIYCDRKTITVFGLLTAWERSLYCTGKFERIGDNLLIAKKHQDGIGNDYFLKGDYRIKIIRRYIDTNAYLQLKQKFPVIDMHLQGVSTQPVIT
ncbi:hypothetical protein [Sediminibacterium sp.]|uniref:hypothetical protein n=1 Tax=Sediminibacterium sp. TaxID=1917865 RepID=UPI003F69BE80